MNWGSDVQGAVARLLAALASGFGPLVIHEGVPGVPAFPGARIRIPSGTRSLFVRWFLPERIARAGPIEILVHRPAAAAVTRVSVGASDVWSVIPVEGESEVRLEGPSPWPGAGVPGVGEARLLVLLRDLEFLASDVRDRCDLDATHPNGPRFLTVRMDLTNKCNLRCRMCPLSFDEIFHQRKDYMSVERFAALAEQILPRTYQLTLSAGYEPLLHPRFDDVLRVLAPYAVPHVEFTTNGTLIDERLMHVFIDTGVRRITFSVDGAKAETYEHIRRGADFQKFHHALEVFARVKRERGAELPELSFNMTLLRRNVDELSDVMRLGKRHGLAVMHTALMVPHAGLEMESESLELDRARANAAFARAREEARRLELESYLPDDYDLERPEGPVATLPAAPEYTLAREWGKGRGSRTLTRESAIGEVAIEDSGEVCEPSETERPRTPSATLPDMVLDLPAATSLPAPKRFGSTEGATMVVGGAGSASRVKHAYDDQGQAIDTACVYPWTMAIVRPDRQVVPCCQWHDFETMGSLDERSFAEIWNGEAYRRLRTELQVGRFRPACEHCPERRGI